MPKKREYKNLTKPKTQAQIDKIKEKKATNTVNNLATLFIKKGLIQLSIAPWKDLQNSKKGEFIDPSQYCSHLIIGSSQFHYLINGTLRAKTVHKKEIAYHEQNALANSRNYQMGKFWEDVVEEWSHLRRHNNKHQQYPLRIIEKNPFMVSSEVPFIGAQPDFLAQIKVKNSWNLVLLEVKSTTIKDTFKTAKKSIQCPEYLQVQTALNVFQMEKAFLIYFLVSKEDTSIQLDMFCKEVIHDNIFKKCSHQIAIGFASYLASLSAYDRDNEPARKIAARELTEPVLKEMVLSRATNFKTTKEQLKLSGPRQKNPCFIIDKIQSEYRKKPHSPEFLLPVKKEVRQEPLENPVGRPKIRDHLKVKTIQKMTKRRNTVWVTPPTRTRDVNRLRHL